MPKKGMSHRILVSLPNEQFDLVEELADHMGMPVASFVRFYLNESEAGLREMLKALRKMKAAATKRDALLALTAGLGEVQRLNVEGQMHLMDTVAGVSINPEEPNPLKEKPPAKPAKKSQKGPRKAV